ASIPPARGTVCTISTASESAGDRLFPRRNLSRTPCESRRTPTSFPGRLGPVPHAIDQELLALPLRTLADAALARARELGAEHADFRLERIQTQNIRLRDASLDGTGDYEQTGFAVRVVHSGSWGFASGVILTPTDAVRVAEQAVE